MVKLVTLTTVWILHLWIHKNLKKEKNGGNYFSAIEKLAETYVNQDDKSALIKQL